MISATEFCEVKEIFRHLVKVLCANTLNDDIQCSYDVLTKQKLLETTSEVILLYEESEDSENDSLRNSSASFKYFRNLAQEVIKGLPCCSGEEKKNLYARIGLL